MSMFLDVLGFMKKYGQPIGAKGVMLAKNSELASFRRRLLEEELKELDEAIIDEDPVEIADAIGDIIFVLIGTAITYGIDLRTVWKEIVVTNMTKIMIGDPLKAKVSKPPDWVPPNIELALELGEDLQAINTGE